jgi:hypothetical protein
MVQYDNFKQTVIVIGLHFLAGFYSSLYEPKKYYYTYLVAQV